MGSDESYFNVSVGNDGQSQDCPQTTAFLKRKESRSGIEPRSFRLPAYCLTARPNRLSTDPLIGFIFCKVAVEKNRHQCGAQIELSGHHHTYGPGGSGNRRGGLDRTTPGFKGRRIYGMFYSFSFLWGISNQLALTHAHTDTCARAHAHTHALTYRAGTHARTRAHARTHMHARTYARTHAHIHPPTIRTHTKPQYTI